MRNWTFVAAIAAALATLGATGTGVPSAEAAAPTEIAPSSPLPELPRNQQLILGWSISSPIGVTNPWAVFFLA